MQDTGSHDRSSEKNIQKQQQKQQQKHKKQTNNISMVGLLMSKQLLTHSQTTQ